MQRGGSIKGLNGNGKNTIKKLKINRNKKQLATSKKGKERKERNTGDWELKVLNALISP